ncbi:hypothetical protein ACS0TY_027193 [Phlomoides rotata]
MRDVQFQTPQRDQHSANRRQKTASDLNKNLRKVTKKSLNPAFKAVSEDDSAVLESLNELSEASDENPYGECVENFLASVNLVDTSSSETAAISDLASQSESPSSVITSHKHAAVNETNTKIPEVDSLNKIKSIEAELVIKHLQEARIQVMKSNDLGPSKKLLKALINIIIEEIHGGLYEESDWLDKLLSGKSNLVILSFGMAIIVLLMLWFLRLSSLRFLATPTPT